MSRYKTQPGILLTESETVTRVKQSLVSLRRVVLTTT